MELMEESSITTVQAGVLIHIIYNMYSMDKLGITYGVQAVAIAKDLKVFESSCRPKSKARQQVYDFTAWCLYYWMRYVLCPSVSLAGPESWATDSI
jgi:hypothetical protein